MKLFFENVTQNEKIPLDFPLEAALEQALEVFETLPEDDGSVMGIVTDQGIVLQFRKYNKFMWLVEIPDISKHGVYQSICNPNQCVRLIEELFSGVDPFLVCEFKFHSYL